MIQLLLTDGQPGSSQTRSKCAASEPRLPVPGMWRAVLIFSAEDGYRAVLGTPATAQEADPSSAAAPPLTANRTSAVGLLALSSAATPVPVPRPSVLSSAEGTLPSFIFSRAHFSRISSYTVINISLVKILPKTSVLFLLSESRVSLRQLKFCGVQAKLLCLGLILGYRPSRLRGT